MKEVRFDIPLEIMLPRVKKKDKKFILNFNNLRTTHYRTLNEAKQKFTAIVEIPEFNGDVISIDYSIYAKSRHVFDVNNVISVLDKFLCDAIVKRGYIPDDNFNHIPEMPTGRFVEVDKENPRAEVIVTIIK